jgi:hypothetical protein
MQAELWSAGCPIPSCALPDRHQGEHCARSGEVWGVDEQGRGGVASKPAHRCLSSTPNPRDPDGPYARCARNHNHAGDHVDTKSHLRWSSAHDDCERDEPCAAGRPAECPREPARKFRRDAKAGAWGKLEVRREGMAGLRHYLGEWDIHCGAAIELQAIEHRCDPDGNEVAWYVDRGVVVRYEASQDGREISATLYAGVAGCTFVAAVEPWMRFRRPVRS